MENVLDFIRAASPWVAMGILLLILFAKGASDKKKGTAHGNYGTEGMCLGMCFGTALGASFGDNAGLGISIGMLIGLAIGSCISQQDDAQDEKKEQHDS